MKREQQKKWLEELDKQKEADKLRKMEEKCNFLKVVMVIKATLRKNGRSNKNIYPAVFLENRIIVTEVQNLYVQIA